MKIKTHDLSGPALNWAVAKCGFIPGTAASMFEVRPYATDWSQGGPIIERERIGLWAYQWDEEGNENPGWYAEDEGGDHVRTGPTPLIAAMRCFVASKMGDEIEIPDELQ